MPKSPLQFTPFLPEQAEDLEDLALEIIKKSAALGARQHQITLRSLKEMLRVINSYYSNLIEGHNTHPRDIVRAMRQDYDAEPAKRNLQIESLAHIRGQQLMEARLRDEPDLVVTSGDFLTFLHYEFYYRVPEEFLVVTDPETGKVSYVVPGKFREEEVVIGRHVPPCHNDLITLIDRFADVYRPDRHHGAKKLLAAAASHHRLMWVHPFLDGNGRVARLFTEAYLRKISIEGFGLWSISRGLARKSTDYKAALSWADESRRNDLDGRGALTNTGLTSFCRFFLEVCLDQVDYMGSLLQIDGLIDRIQGYINLRNNNIALGPEGASPLRTEAGRMLQEVLLHGETARGALMRASGLKERTARNLLTQLLDEGLLLSDSAKGFVRMGFPIHATGWLFPELYPR